MKTVLITGVDKGIGFALANIFLKEKYFVVGTFLNKNNIFDENFSAIKLDLSDPQSIDFCVSEIKNLNKKIDILINNAGILCDQDETSVVIDKLRKTLEVNLIGTIDFTEKIIPLISNSGSIVNISSSAGSIENTGIGFSHFPNHYPSYKISKAGLNMYTRTLALRLKDENIMVSAIHPGWVKTDMGGKEAHISSEESAKNIFDEVASLKETGQFWFNGKEFPW